MISVPAPGRAAVAALMLALLSPLAAPAQEKPGKPVEKPGTPLEKPGTPLEKEDEERIENRVPFPGPSKELARLQPLVGAWRGEETWREPRRYKRGEYEGFPGAEGYLTRTVEPGPGELSLVFRDDGRGPMGGVQGSGAIGWDPVTRFYLLDSVSSVFPGILRLTGRFEGADLVLSGDDTSTGEKRAVRLVVNGLGPDGWTETLSRRESGRWEEVVRRTFRKAPPGSHP